MHLSNLISDATGGIHLLFSVVALIAGTYILFGRKGTVLHRKIGYLYTIAMTLVLVTAFVIYNLYGSFGIFHWLALVSSVTLVGGMVPMFLKLKGALAYHISFMYWSVVGLYGAFVAETLVRFPKVVVESGIPNGTFYLMTGIGVFVVMSIGNIVFFRNKDKWLKRYTAEFGRVEEPELNG
ncbi:hypothetical protein CEQ90_01080 [Lewinellaceae bacterium SD302]|nr:hypothetical protein CEQ90_01080 [Lewinellaceae bacterium SD302]